MEMNSYNKIIRMNIKRNTRKRTKLKKRFYKNLIKLSLKDSKTK